MSEQDSRFTAVEQARYNLQALRLTAGLKIGSCGEILSNLVAAVEWYDPEGRLGSGSGGC